MNAPAPRDQTRARWILTGWKMHLIAREKLFAELRIRGC
jgi:hypothetical protein